MTKTSNISTKLIVGFVAFAMIFSFSFQSARAATMTTTTTTTDLQTQITALMAQIAALQGGSTMTHSCSFTVNLKKGSKGADVTALQIFLMAHGQTIPAGATGYFGGQTKAALAGFQAANGIMPAVGFFGPITRASINVMCSVVTTTTTGTTTGTTTTTTTTSDLKGGEATLSNFQIRSGSKTDLQEGIKDAAVAELQFKTKGGDVKATRFDFTFNGAAASIKSPWNVFDTVTVWNNGSKIASVDASNETNWNTTATPYVYTIRATGAGAVVRDGDNGVFTVGVSVQNGTDIGVGITDAWTLAASANGVRAIDAAGVDQYIPSTISSTQAFTVGKKGVDDELNIKSASANPDSTTIKVETNKTTDWTTIFAWTIDTKNSPNDIDVRTIPVTVTVPGDAYSDVVNNARLMVGSKTYSNMTTLNPASSTATLTFNIDKGDFTIAHGDKAVVSLQVKFNSLPLVGNLYNQGQTIFATTTATGVTAKGAKDLTASQITGAATGKTHTLRTQGLIVAKNSTSVSLTVDPVSNTANKGVFTVKFDTTAFQNDVWVNKSTAQGTVMGTAGVNYIIRDSNGIVVATGTPTSALSSTAETDGTRFKVNQGETKSFTLSVSYDPAGVAGQYFTVEVYSVNFNAGINADPVTQQLTLPVADYQTAALSI